MTDKGLREWIQEQNEQKYETVEGMDHGFRPRRRTPEEKKAFIEWIINTLFPTEIVPSDVCTCCTNRRPCVVYESEMCVFPLCEDCLSLSQNTRVQEHLVLLKMKEKLFK